MSAADPFALGQDGAALAPRAFQQALRDDAEKMAQLAKDPELAAVLLGDDVAAMQELLKSAHKARGRAHACKQSRLVAQMLHDARSWCMHACMHADTR